MADVKLFGIAGYKNSGKTTLVVELVQELCRRGLRVGTVKHAHHEFDIDHPGKDSYEHRRAGAKEVIVASAKRWAHICELEASQEPPLEELLKRFGELDIVLIEGYKQGIHPKIELRRAGIQPLNTAGIDTGVVAVVSDAPDKGATVPVFMRNDLGAIADFILANAESL